MGSWSLLKLVFTQTKFFLVLLIISLTCLTASSFSPFLTGEKNLKVRERERARERERKKICIWKHERKLKLRQVCCKMKAADTKFAQQKTFSLHNVTSFQFSSVSVQPLHDSTTTFYLVIYYNLTLSQAKKKRKKFEEPFAERFVLVSLLSLLLLLLSLCCCIKRLR